jgi:hypothetical protein
MTDTALASSDDAWQYTKWTKRPQWVAERTCRDAAGKLWTASRGKLVEVCYGDWIIRGMQDEIYISRASSEP